MHINLNYHSIMKIRERNITLCLLKAALNYALPYISTIYSFQLLKALLSLCSSSHHLPFFFFSLFSLFWVRMNADTHKFISLNIKVYIFCENDEFILLLKRIRWNTCINIVHNISQWSTLFIVIPLLPPCNMH